MQISDVSRGELQGTISASLEAVGAIGIPAFHQQPTAKEQAKMEVY